MRVDVDDAGRQNQSLRADPLARSPEIPAYRDDSPVLDGHAVGSRRATETVDDDGVVDHEVVHGASPVWTQPR